MNLNEKRNKAEGWLWAGPISPVLPPRLAFIEMAVLLALVLLEYFWEGFPSLTRINPHPYWIAVLLLSLQYGTVSGLIAAGLAIFGTVLIGMPEPDIEERYFNYLVRVWTQPVLWLLVAMVLGTFRARQIEQRDDLVRQIDNLKIRGATLLDHATNLRARCSVLERTIATQGRPDASKLLNALGQLDEAEPGRWAAALAAALNAGFPNGQFSLYAAVGDHFRLIFTHGEAPAARRPMEIDARHPIVAGALLEGRSLSVLDAADDTALRGLGVAAVPIFADPAHGAGSRAAGMLKADILEPDQINGSLVRRLGIVAFHLAPVLKVGLLVPVAAKSGTASEGLPQSQVETSATAANPVPVVHRWRALRWLQGGRNDGSTPAAIKPGHQDD